MFQAILVDPQDEEELAQLPWERTRVAFEAAALDLAGAILELHGKAGFTTYYHILLQHGGELIEQGWDFARMANYDIEGKHAQLKRTTKGVAGHKNHPRFAVEQDHLGSNVKKKEAKDSRDAKARKALLQVGKAPLGRRPNPSKAPLHTLRIAKK